MILITVFAVDRFNIVPKSSLPVGLRHGEILLYEYFVKMKDIVHKRRLLNIFSSEYKIPDVSPIDKETNDTFSGRVYLGVSSLNHQLISLVSKLFSYWIKVNKGQQLYVSVLCRCNLLPKKTSGCDGSQILWGSSDVRC